MVLSHQITASCNVCIIQHVFSKFVSYFTPILWFNKPSKELNFKSFHYGNFRACLLYCQEGLDSPAN